MTAHNAPIDAQNNAANREGTGTVYVVVESKFTSGDVGGCLLRDSGEVLWGHMSNGVGWLQRDLTNGFTDRREQLEALYPNGYDVVVIDGPDAKIPDEVLARNKAWGDKEQSDE